MDDEKGDLTRNRAHKRLYLIKRDMLTSIVRRSKLQHHTNSMPQQDLEKEDYRYGSCVKEKLTSRFQRLSF